MVLIGSQRSQPWQDSIDHHDNEKIRIRRSSVSASPVHANKPSILEMFVPFVVSRDVSSNTHMHT